LIFHNKKRIKTKKSDKEPVGFKPIEYLRVKIREYLIDLEKK